MLSILIPVYNYDVQPLVEEIHQQATSCEIVFEIIIIDDFSTQIPFDIDHVKQLSNIKLIFNKQNIGRSAIRNLLATEATYENLLFIDAGTFPKSEKFISNYLNTLEHNITVGGMTQKASATKKPYKLRWLYTKKREACSFDDKNHNPTFTSANFLIKKSILKSHPFDESIKRYGFEDFIFFNNLKINGYHLNFINNPVIHDAKEDANTYLVKTEDGLKNLVLLSNKNKDLIRDIKIVAAHTKIKTLGLSSLVILIYNIIKPILIKNFNSSHPSLLLFDFYKLGYYCTLISHKK
ncbi:glycosyltransferase [Winogradskyella undariae]|uniref:glycosyltransferase family 2 protein n=1 Tax=Winogradskyella undariae TaxID=1285465 RepID=UPI00156BB722|nr:glycosyltransferase [Winogradskyella undariae]NRR92724.1 glycosyltransferase [Winogradskyella undariae]